MSAEKTHANFLMYTKFDLTRKYDRMNLEELRNEIAFKQKKGLPFIFDNYNVSVVTETRSDLFKTWFLQTLKNSQP